MDEYAALAQRVVLTMDDVRGCLVLSRDGMVLGAYPEEDEQAFKPAWLKFVHVGEARRGFVEFSDQLWAYVHRGPYAAFVISGIGVRPGVLLDQLEQAVLAAEETRAKKGDTLKVPDASSAPSGRPRTSLHPAETRRTADRRGATGPTPAGNVLGHRARDAFGSPRSVRDGRLGLLPSGGRAGRFGGRCAARSRAPGREGLPRSGGP
ncbi:MAG: hypothetical protein E6G65_09770 [Actinobacteria bacterium]|nr:MAG: hypothetical protein E6G65_09770 [Actinomycetota bacterium]